MIKQWKIPTITGNSNDATDRPIYGEILAIYLKYAITPNANADVVIATVNDPPKTILTVTDNATSGWFYPREIIDDTTGTAVTFDGTNEMYAPIPVSDYIKATVAQGDSDQTLDVWILIRE